jgi:16S rRNA (uracil1498-N3)-methyltransferase
MPRFFIASSGVHLDGVSITGADARHLTRSLRIRAGDIITVVEDFRVEHGVVVETADARAVTGRIMWSRAATGEPRLQLHVLQSIPARDTDSAVASLAGIGCASIRPVITSRTVYRYDRERGEVRVRRWQTIARQAAQLAGRARIPDVHPVQSLERALDELALPCLILACVLEAAATPLHRTAITVDVPVALVIGPEGGLDDADLRLLDRAGATRVHVGPRVVPSSSAGLVAATLTLAAAGDLDAAVAPPPLPT